MRIYRVDVTCGCGFASLDKDYDKTLHVLVIDDGVDFIMDSSRLAERGVQTEVQCPHCDEELRLPYLPNTVETSTRAYSMNNPMTPHATHTVNIGFVYFVKDPLRVLEQLTRFIKEFGTKNHLMINLADYDVIEHHVNTYMGTLQTLKESRHKPMPETVVVEPTDNSTFDVVKRIESHLFNFLVFLVMATLINFAVLIILIFKVSQ